MTALFGYQSMPEVHKNNLKYYIIYDGIFTVLPSISEEDAEFIFKICNKVENENINPYSVAHYLTDQYTRGNITKKELEEATSGEISEAVFYDNLNYIKPIVDKENDIEIKCER